MRMQGMQQFFTRIFFFFALILPISAFAQVISVSATTPFPSSVTAGSSTNAVYTVLNETSSAAITAINQSDFPSGSGLSISSTTCGSPMAPGASCTMTVTLTAPTTAQTISGTLKVWAKPTVYGAKVPVSVSIANPVITPSAGSNGSISPSSAQTVTYGSSLAFTATPSTNYTVDEWLVDGVSVQTGGTTYTLSSITASHTVAVTFRLITYDVTPSAGTGGSISPSTVQEVDHGSNVTFTATPSTNYGINEWLVDSVSVQTGGTTYTISNVTADHTIQVTFKAATGISVAAGADTATGSHPALLASSTDAGLTWAKVTNYSSALPATSTFRAVSCVGSSTTGICAAGGDNSDNGAAASVPWLLATTSDSGETWAQKTITNTPPTNGNFNSTSCTGTGGTAICIAAGEDKDSSIPFLAASTDGGINWAKKSITSIPAAGLFYASSCTGSSSSAICVAGGDDGTAPYLAVSTDGAATWATKTITSNITNGAIYAASCTGDAPNTRCVLVGQNTGTNAPLLISSTDGSAATFTVQTVSGQAASGIWNAVSCTGSGSTAICVAAGVDSLTSSPELAVSTNGGSSFTVTPVTGIASSGAFNGASCTGTTTSAMCIAAGDDGSAPILAQSTNGGTTWNAVTTFSPALPGTGSFNSASCTGTTTTISCTASGIGSGAPIVVTTNDSGTSWGNRTITSVPATGQFFGSSNTGGTLKAKN